MSLFTDISSQVGNVTGSIGSAVSNITSTAGNILNGQLPQTGISGVDKFLSNMTGLGTNTAGQYMRNMSGWSNPNLSNIEGDISQKLADSKANYIMYPDNLFDPYRGVDHATIIFYINVNTESKYYAANSAQMTGSSMSPAGQNMMTGSSGIASNISGGINSMVNSVSSSLSGIVGSMSGAISSAANAAFGSLQAVQQQFSNITGLTFNDNVTAEIKESTEERTEYQTTPGDPLSKTTKRMIKAIALPMPNDIKASYGAQYNTVDLGDSLIGKAAGMMLDNNMTAENIENGLKNAISNNKGKYVVGILGSMFGDIGKVVNQKMGIAVNPRKEMTFVDMDKRTFSYSFMFAPKSKSEYDAVLEIIALFKIHMHPELFDDLHLMYRTPSEFDIQYHYGQGINTKLHNISACYLESLNVNYTPNGSWTNHPDGYPTQLSLDLTFKEIETLTRERITEWELGEGNYSMGSSSSGVTQQTPTEKSHAAQFTENGIP